MIEAASKWGDLPGFYPSFGQFVLAYSQKCNNNFYKINLKSFCNSPPPKNISAPQTTILNAPQSIIYGFGTCLKYKTHSRTCVAITRFFTLSIPDNNLRLVEKPNNSCYFSLIFSWYFGQVRFCQVLLLKHCIFIIFCFISSSHQISILECVLYNRQVPWFFVILASNSYFRRKNLK